MKGKRKTGAGAPGSEARKGGAALGHLHQHMAQMPAEAGPQGRILEEESDDSAHGKILSGVPDKSPGDDSPGGAGNQ